jgi:hypothetical protein
MKPWRNLYRVNGIVAETCAKSTALGAAENLAVPTESMPVEEADEGMPAGMEPIVSSPSEETVMPAMGILTLETTPLLPLVLLT